MSGSGPSKGRGWAQPDAPRSVLVIGLEESVEHIGPQGVDLKEYSAEKLEALGIGKEYVKEFRGHIGYRDVLTGGIISRWSKWRHKPIGRGRELFYIAPFTPLDEDEADKPAEDDEEDVDAIWLTVADTWSRSLDELKALRSDLQLLKTTIDP